MSKPTDSSRLSLLFLSLSVVSLVLCALGATAHYLKWALGNPWQLVGWLLSMVFLLLAFLPGPSELGANFKSVIKPKTAFFLFWILFFVVAHLWNFRTAPWNGDGIFEDAAVDLLYLKTHVTSRPFQAAWFHPYGPIAHETLFHYYLWPWLHLFGYNILTNEAALLADRKSTRLNSSHSQISYAVFCLKKKNRTSANVRVSKQRPHPSA